MCLAFELKYIKSKQINIQSCMCKRIKSDSNQAVSTV